jgi:hypothetical protein
VRRDTDTTGPTFGQLLLTAIRKRIADTMVQCVWCGEMSERASCQTCRDRLAKGSSCSKCGQPANGYPLCWTCTKGSLGIKTTVTSESDSQFDMR